MGKTIKQHYLDRLGAAGTRKLLIRLGLRNLVIKRDFYVYMGYAMPKEPVTFNEKVTWTKLFRKDERMITLTDKYRVREWVAEKIGKEYLIPLLGYYKNGEEFFENLDTLSCPFVLKSTNGGGGREVLLCRAKEEIQKEKLAVKIQGWLSQDLYYRNGEWQYRYLTPQLICEKMIGENPSDYKIFCFHGKPYMIQVDANRFEKHRQQFFTPDWEQLSIRYVASSGEEVFEKPEGLSEMLSVAAKLSEDFEFVRVDLYYEQGQIYFGEMTFTPNNGCCRFEPHSWDEKLGAMWKLDQNCRRIGADGCAK